MKVTYDSILNLLSKKYSVISKEKKNYFVNENGEVVASYNKDYISMLFDFPACSREIWNHEGKVVVTFAKDFQVNSYVADVIILEGLCGTENDTEVIGNRTYSTISNEEIYNINGKSPLQEKFESLPYEEKIKMLEEITGATFTGANIDGLRISFGDEKEPTYGSCGFINSNNGIANIEIYGEKDIDIRNIKVSDHMFHNDFVVNVMNIKAKSKNFDYNNVYEFWRKKNDWYYTIGRKNVSSPSIIKWTERRRYSTVDKSAINIVGNPYKTYLDPVYYNSKISMNARRLQMMSMLSELVPKRKIASIMDSYDFNLRNIDVNKQLRKRNNNI